MVKELNNLKCVLILSIFCIFNGLILSCKTKLITHSDNCPKTICSRLQSNFDGWKEDSLGCIGLRQGAIYSSSFSKSQLLGLNVNCLHEILGSPNKKSNTRVLWKTVPKSYAYYVSSVCKDDESLDKTYKVLLISFNKKGNVSLALLMDGEG